MRKVMLVTGASAGIGREVALLLAREGQHVYAAARRLDRMRDLAEHGIVPVEMDVTKEDDNVEDIPLDDARYQFEVNLFGLAHLTQLVLPHMRAQRSGRIINVSSMLGRVFVPLGAWYHATKHALEGWSDCLRWETAPFNIQVVVIQPGAIKTEFAAVMGAWMRKYGEGTAYRAQVDRFLGMMEDPGVRARGTEPEVIARVFLEAATTARPRRRYISGAMARPMMFLRKWCGDGVYEFVLRRALR